MLLPCCCHALAVKVEDKGRQQLRRFRAQAGIDAQEHLLALKKQVIVTPF